MREYEKTRTRKFSTKRQVEMTKLVGEIAEGRRGGGGGDYFLASENWSGRVHFEGHSAEWRVLSKLTVQPCYAQDTFGQNDFGLMWGGHTT